MLKSRYLSTVIKKDAFKDKKMAFVSGPRQVGKTTLGKQLLKDSGNYFSWDQTEFRKIWVRSPDKIREKIGAGPILLDEIHKDRQWKSRLKGFYDTYADKLSILVMGSSKLDIYRRGSDSLMGRYIPYRLNPFSVAETTSPPGPEHIFQQETVSYQWEDLMALGGYPEPLLSGQEKKAKRWSRLRLDRLAYEDTRDIKAISHLNSFRVLLDLIPEKTGSLFSFHSLKEDLGVAYATVRDWVLLSELLYYGFFVRPYSKKINRSVESRSKFYLYDILQVENPSARQENLTALHLLKACQFWTDTAEGLFELFFVRDKEKREVDFLICQNKKPWILLECKSKDKNLSPHLVHYAEKLKTPLNFQLVNSAHYDKKHLVCNIRVIGYEKFFSGWL